MQVKAMSGKKGKKGISGAESLQKNVNVLKTEEYGKLPKKNCVTRKKRFGVDR